MGDQIHSFHGIAFVQQKDSTAIAQIFPYTNKQCFPVI